MVFILKHVYDKNQDQIGQQELFCNRTKWYWIWFRGGNGRGGQWRAGGWSAKRVYYIHTGSYRPSLFHLEFHTEKDLPFTSTKSNIIEISTFTSCTAHPPLTMTFLSSRISSTKNHIYLFHFAPDVPITINTSINKISHNANPPNHLIFIWLKRAGTKN